MGTGRWRFELVEDVDSLPVLWRPPSRVRQERRLTAPGGHAALALFAACELLSHRGVGDQSWALSFRHDPIAFLLDALGDAVNLWGPGGELLYRNHAAERLDLGPPQASPLEIVVAGENRLERRCLRFQSDGADYVLEIIHALAQ